MGNKLEDLAGDDGRLKLEKDGMYDENGERVLPFSEDFVRRVLVLAVKMVRDGKLPDGMDFVYTETSCVRQTFQQILRTLHISRHSEVPERYWIDQLRLHKDGLSWVVYLEDNFGKTTIAKTDRL